MVYTADLKSAGCNGLTDSNSVTRTKLNCLSGGTADTSSLEVDALTGVRVQFPLQVPD